MARLTQPERWAIARTRLSSILGRHGIATARTLEQKISDAGPFNQRIDPHVLTTVRAAMLKQGVLRRRNVKNTPWYSLATTPNTELDARLAAQLPVYNALHFGDVGLRVGQTLEISTYRALLEQQQLGYLGAYADLESHDDGSLYSKEEPPTALSGRRIPGKKRLDFLVHHPSAGWCGVEIKNVREWLYPDRTEIKEMILKALALDVVPVLIARRIPFVTFKVLSPCGVVFHQTYNQFLPLADQALAEQARDKHLLGYHDIRLGNTPDARLMRFVTSSLPRILVDARKRFDEYKDLLDAYATGAMKYPEFAGRARRRSLGEDEDGKFPEPEPDDFPPDDE